MCRELPLKPTQRLYTVGPAVKKKETVSMKFEYAISRYPADDFKQLVYLCSDSGECNFEEMDSDQTTALRDLLNEKGDQGWELVQIYFRQEGIVAIWKRGLLK
jgi:hypothetical protein